MKKSRFLFLTFLFLITLTVCYPNGIRDEMKETEGNEYSLEYYTYDYEEIYRSAQLIPEFSLYHSGPGGTRCISEKQTFIDYVPNMLYVMNERDENFTLHTVDGNIINLGAIVNEELERYYRISGREIPHDYSPYWTGHRLSDNIYGAFNHLDAYSSVFLLLDLSGSQPSVYFEERIEGVNDSDLFRRVGSNEIITDSRNLYIIYSVGVVGVYAIDGYYLKFEKVVRWQECRIPGWKGGERFLFADDRTVSAYDFASGTERTLGTKTEKPPYNFIQYEDADGQQFIMTRSGKSRPWPEDEADEGYNFVGPFDRGYIYANLNINSIAIFFYENNKITRKIIISCGIIAPENYHFSFNIFGDKIYMGTTNLVFSIDLNTMQVIKAFSSVDNEDYGVVVFMFPFGEDDVVFTEWR